MNSHILYPGDKIVIASHNTGKIQEISALLAPFNIETTSSRDLDLPVPEETGSTFIENAVIKACAAQAATGLPSLADDSGLEVEGLDGAPGVYCADWSGPKRDFASAMRRVREELVNRGRWLYEKPAANFISTIVISWVDGTLKSYEGKTYGCLVWPPRGDLGYGYDPIFQPDGYNKTFAEMHPAENIELKTECKAVLSHRSRALELFINECISKV